ncbi:MAG: dTDP-4-dehydrorhamnose 3,5-epimerase [bacterium]|nr:dTDP-4-dehydrorhamnose 3,5-epimerase [bacterium]
MTQDNYPIITLANYKDVNLIHDVVVRPLKVFADPRGSLVELLKTSWNDVYDQGHMPFSQTYVSFTNFNIARDEELFHYHPNGQRDRFVILQGEAAVLVYDDREGSPTKGVLNLFKLSGLERPDNCYMIVVPSYTLHGFLATGKDGTLLINFPTHLYDPANEQRIRFEERPLPGGSAFSWQRARKLLGLPIPNKPVTK